MYSTILRERSRAFPKLLGASASCSELLFARHMGGGPRTFPGGINKWQWKRLHENRAKEKEKSLLDQEKQLYQARRRSEIRAKIAGNSVSPAVSDPGITHSPMSSADHCKALADRFVKPGAEDLWNEDDGPLKPKEQAEPNRTDTVDSSIGVTKSKPNRHKNLSSASIGSNFMKSRSYSVESVRYSLRDCSSDSSIDMTNSMLNRLNLAGNCENLNSASIGSNFMKSRSYSMESVRYGLRNCSSGSTDSSIGMMKLKSNWSNHEILNSGRIGCNFMTNRSFSVQISKEKSGSSVRTKKSSNQLGRRFRKVGVSSSDEDSDDDYVDNSALRMKNLGGEKSSGEDEDDSGRKSDMRKKKGSGASLGKYDIKIKRRVPLNSLESEIDPSREIEIIRHEVSKRKLARSEVEKSEELVLSDKRFDECGVSSLTVKALSDSGFVRMTKMQEATLAIALEGTDAMVKAKTVTGKTAAFLIPAIEAVLKAMSSKSNHRVPPVYALVLCPTRELTSQIAAEAKVMLQYHDGIGVQTLVGGTRFKDDERRLESDPCQIIIATPGRLLDHVESKSGLSARLMGLKLFVVDEADHLLDLGFRKDVEKIVDCLPRRRQSLVFSAAIPKEVRRISQVVLKREHAFIDTVGLSSVETRAKVKQSYLIAPHDQHFQILHHLLKEHISQVFNYKVIVFCSTAMVTSLTHQLLREVKMNVMEMHSRKTEHYQARISEEFGEAKQFILVSSDVSAREMNYPDITLVIQMGIPMGREEFIQRMRRTGRGNKEGESVLLLAPWEEYFLDEVKDLSLEGLPSPCIDPDIKLKTKESLASIDTSVKEAAYHAWLGYYNSIKEIGRDKTTLVELANRFCASIGLENPPALFRKTAVKMGLRDIQGIRVRK